MSDLATALGVVTLSLFVAVGLARFALGGILRAAFHRARALVRRVLTRRRTERPEADRRQLDARRN
jgi:hypothetical protein